MICQLNITTGCHYCRALVIVASNYLYLIENDSFSIIPAKEKLANKELIVIVQSRPNAFEARQTNRDTWIKTGKNAMI